MTSAAPEDNRERELGQRLLLDWRVRCGLRHSAVEATSSPQAMALCVAVARTLQHGTGGPELALAACTWSSSVASRAEARAALLCLCDVAAEAGTTTVDGLPAYALDVVLEQLAIVAAPAPAPGRGPAVARHDVDPLTGCRGRRAFEADLDDHASLARASGGELSVVLAELTPRSAKRARGAAHLAAVPGDVEVLGLVATLRRATGSPRPLYRIADHRFALLLPGTNRGRAGELMLLASCGSGPGFDWGVGSLSSAGPRAAADAGVVTMLADADLHIRRRDLSHAKGALARRRRSSAVTGAAAALALLGGSAFALDGGTGGGTLQAALRAPGATAHAPAGTNEPGPGRQRVPATTVPAPPPAPPPAPSSTADPSLRSTATVAAAEVAPPAAAAPPTARTVAAVLPVTPPTAAPPAPAPAVPPVTPPTTTPPVAQPPNLVSLVSELVHEAKHAVPWFKGRHSSRS